MFLQLFQRKVLQRKYISLFQGYNIGDFCHIREMSFSSYGYVSPYESIGPQISFPRDFMMSFVSCNFWAAESKLGSVMHFVHKILKFSRGKSRRERGRRSVTFHCFRSKGAVCLCVCKTQIFPHFPVSEREKWAFFSLLLKSQEKDGHKKISAIAKGKIRFSIF